MTFMYEINPYSLEMSLYRVSKYELPMSWFSKVIVWQTDRQTDTTEIIYHAASRVVRKNWKMNTARRSSVSYRERDVLSV